MKAIETIHFFASQMLTACNKSTAYAANRHVAQRQKALCTTQPL
jgi:hypothetical protein